MPDSLETQDRIGPTMTESHFVLSIAEILLEILEYLSVKELGVAASVCKAWLGPAVDTRWRVQKIRLSRLLAKLAPVKKSQLDHTMLAPRLTLRRTSGVVSWNSMQIGSLDSSTTQNPIRPPLSSSLRYWRG
ncbi:hypothetical protein FRB95_014916 [Tulasnella sp. JGI-2019a]|nr:hypothetical protein FRB95_014916 [Tulasnella sp. JGI-2019a]